MRSRRCAGPRRSGAWLILMLACRGGAAEGTPRALKERAAHAEPPSPREPRATPPSPFVHEQPRATPQPHAPATPATEFAYERPGAAEQPHAPALEPATRALTLDRAHPHQVCATLGTLRPSPDALFLVDDPKLRATLAGSRGRGVELSFRYLGPTAKAAQLRSGSERRQLGLELAARDTCNLLYVMWRIEPTTELVVSVKRNGAQSTHIECENRGYHPLRPSVSAPLPALAPGSEHQLRAEIERGMLWVQVDGATVWSGALDPSARELSGKSGLRSDNARFEVLALGADLESTAATCGDP